MRFPTEKKQSRNLTPEILAICLLLASSLQIMENLLPRIPIFPWLRLGLSYLILLPFLLRFGVINTLMLFLSRNLITLVYGGQIFSSFMISSISGVFSLVVIGPATYYLYHKRQIGLLGVSILLAGSFNVIQLIVVNLFFVHHGDFYFQLAPLLAWSLFSGSLIGFLVVKSDNGLTALFDSGQKLGFHAKEQTGKSLSKYEWMAFTLIWFLFVALLAISDIGFQWGSLAALLVVTRFRKLKTVFYAWPFYFYIAWLHLFRTDGIYIYKDWITQEGVNNFIFYTIRATNIIICGQLLAKYIPALWKRSAGNLYIKGVGYALPVLPALFGLSLSMGREFFHQLRRRNFENLLFPVTERLVKELTNITRTD